MSLEEQGGLTGGERRCLSREECRCGQGRFTGAPVERSGAHGADILPLDLLQTSGTSSIYTSKVSLKNLQSF